MEYKGKKKDVFEQLTTSPPNYLNNLFLPPNRMERRKGKSEGWQGRKDKKIQLKNHLQYLPHVRQAILTVALRH